jgi:hypothetical protein
LYDEEVAAVRSHPGANSPPSPWLDSSLTSEMTARFNPAARYCRIIVVECRSANRSGRNHGWPAELGGPG